MANRITVYEGLDAKDRRRLVRDIVTAFSATDLRTSSGRGADVESETDDQAGSKPIEIPMLPDLIGLDLAVYSQINAALNGGKRHLMFYGPPGTGKTTLAEHVAEKLHYSYTMITGSADWSSQDVIGGYQPVGEGKIKFIPGVLLKNFDRPLIIDELNRCDIDKVIGTLFTVLSGHASTLPYRVEVSDADSPAYVILPKPKFDAAQHEYAPKQEWRILATINSIDKAALYQMSYALTRRFGWIYVDAPKDIGSFLLDWLQREEWNGADTEPSTPIPMELIWQAVNEVRVIGPAPFIDMLRSIRAIDSGVDFLSNPSGKQALTYLDGFYMFVLPLLDGIQRTQAREIAGKVRLALGLGEESKAAPTLLRRLESFAV